MMMRQCVVVIAAVTLCLNAFAEEREGIKGTPSGKKEKGKKARAVAKPAGKKRKKTAHAKKPKASRVAMGKLYLRGIGGTRSILPKLKKEIEVIHGDNQYAANVVTTMKILGSHVEQQPIADPQKRLSVVLDIKKLRKGYPPPLSLKDGDVLYDSGGRRNHGDLYKIFFKMNRSAYVYIMQLDSTGMIYPLFPSKTYGSGPGMENPLPGNQLHQIPPAKRMWIYLDKNKGEESIYFFFSTNPRPDMEAMFKFFEQRNRLLASRGTATRGLTGGTRGGPATRALTRSVRPLAYRGPAGTDYVESAAVQPTLPLPEDATATFNPLQGAKVFHPETSELVITRWFEHR